MTNSEVREVLAKELNRHIGRYWLLPPKSWNPDDDSSSFVVADAALQALKENGLDIQELQAKAAALDEIHRRLSVDPPSDFRNTEFNRGILSAQRTTASDIAYLVKEHRARLIPEESKASR